MRLATDGDGKPLKLAALRTLPSRDGGGGGGSRETGADADAKVDANAVAVADAAAVADSAVVEPSLNENAPCVAAASRAAASHGGDALGAGAGA
jgi:hypothetical protein